MSNIIKIASRHETLAAAVAAAKIDLSYNEELALRDIRNHDKSGRLSDITLGEDGKVYYVYNCDVKLLHKYEPFHSCLDDSPFHLTFIHEGTIEIWDHLPVGRDGKTRATLAKGGCIVTTL
jgi:hypothetical protein